MGLLSASLAGMVRFPRSQTMWLWTCDRQLPVKIEGMLELSSCYATPIALDEEAQTRLHKLWKDR